MIAIRNTTLFHSPLAGGECHLTGKTYQASARPEQAVLPVKWSAFAHERNQVIFAGTVLPVKCPHLEEDVRCAPMRGAADHLVLPVKRQAPHSLNGKHRLVLPVKWLKVEYAELIVHQATIGFAVQQQPAVLPVKRTFQRQTEGWLRAAVLPVKWSTAAAASFYRLNGPTPENRRTLRTNKKAPRQGRFCFVGPNIGDVNMTA